MTALVSRSEEGWRAFLVQLRYLLSARPAGRRRTLYLTGETTGRQALGLAEGGWEQSGPRVAWTVNAEGHLIVVAGRVPLDRPEAARMEVTISTFGLDDEAFDNLHDEWTRRWTPVAAFARVTTANDPSPD